MIPVSKIALEVTVCLEDIARTYHNAEIIDGGSCLVNPGGL